MIDTDLTLTINIALINYGVVILEINDKVIRIWKR